MRKIRIFLLGLVAAFGLSCQADAQSRLPGPWSFKEETVATLVGVHLDAWSVACELMKMKCRDIVMPRVEYGVLPAQFGAFDIGSRIVQVDIRIFSQEVSLPIIVHEMIHYLQDRKYPMRGGLVPLDEACRDEKEAHELVYKWTQTTGIAKNDERVHPWTEAVKFYPGCKL